MSSEKSNAGSVKAATGNGETQMGPEKLPTHENFEGANAVTGPEFGDKSSRTPPGEGSSLALGLSEQSKFENEDPDSLGEGRDNATGKPDGPERGAVNNGGAGAKLQWG
jgi:hypothetical protein